jgi:hypothetical protein
MNVILWIRYIKIFSILEPENRHFKERSFLKMYKTCYVTYNVNIVERSHYVYISPAILRAWHFNGTERFYGHLMSPVTIKKYFGPTVHRYGHSRPAGFDGSLLYGISRQSVQWEPSWYTRTDGQTDLTKLMGTLREHPNAPQNEVLWNHHIVGGPTQKKRETGMGGERQTDGYRTSSDLSQCYKARLDRFTQYKWTHLQI